MSADRKRRLEVSCGCLLTKEVGRRYLVDVF